MKSHKLMYLAPAPEIGDDFDFWDWNHERNENDGWERYSIPLGNSYLGANIFGRTVRERIQITENSLSNPVYKGNGGLGSFAEIYIDFGHENVTGYKRWLDLDGGIAGVSYSCDGARYSRTYFASYPDKVLVTRLESDKAGALSFSVSARIPGLVPYLFEEGDGMGKSGDVSAEGDTVTLRGENEYYKILFEGQIKVISDGEISCDGERVCVSGASAATVLVAVGTNYRLESRVFSEPDPKKKLAPYPHPHEKVCKIISDAEKLSYDELFARHTEDYKFLFSRVSISLCDEEDFRPTDEILREYKSGKTSRYLEELYFYYGRYLLISSSRKGAYPANLQGTWNRYNSSPWSCGYWHNINVQMNYWCAFGAALPELFEPYLDYCEAYQVLAERNADEYIKKHYPENYSEKSGENGWTIGTGAWLYTVSSAPDAETGHSGPGTGGFTTKLLYEYYDFTRDEKVLARVYPLIESMAKFLLKTLVLEDGVWLVKYSASPEQVSNGRYCSTKGCAFDQQMVWENLRDLLRLADVLGIENETVRAARERIDLLSPVIIGASGQVKEFREENFYGEIGEYHHRHISQLVGLYPGTSISRNTPKYMQAAEYTLTERGDKSTGWSTAHKMNLWARTKRGDRAYALYKMLLSVCTAWNLWDLHPPFQIDGNFGGTAGVAEMLLQSHEGHIELIPALPEEWENGEFCGLAARGNFSVSAKWQGWRVCSASVRSCVGGECRVLNCGIKDVLCDGKSVSPEYSRGIIVFDTEKGKTYELIF